MRAMGSSVTPRRRNVVTTKARLESMSRNAGCARTVVAVWIVKALAQLALLVGRGLFDGADAEVDNRLAHGLASRFETPNKSDLGKGRFC